VAHRNAQREGGKERAGGNSWLQGSLPTTESNSPSPGTKESKTLSVMFCLAQLTSRFFVPFYHLPEDRVGKAEGGTREETIVEQQHNQNGQGKQENLHP